MTPAIEWFLTQGVLGVVVFAEAIVIRVLWLRGEAKDAQMFAQAIESAKLLERTTAQLARLNLNGGTQ